MKNGSLLILATLLIFSFKLLNPTHISTNYWLLTEWVIFINAIISTVLIITLSPNPVQIIDNVLEESKKIYRWLWLRRAVVFIISVVLLLFTKRMIYHYPKYNKLNLKQYHTCFGPEVSWKSRPNLKNAEHK